jgi:hypothetical protein
MIGTVMKVCSGGDGAVGSLGDLDPQAAALTARATARTSHTE